MRRLDAGLSREHDLRLLAAAHRRRGRGDQSRQPRVEPAGRNPGLPARPAPSSSAGTSRSTCQPVFAEMLTRGAQRAVVQLAVDLPVQELPAVLVDQVPLVVGDDQRAASVDHHRDDPQVLLGQRLAGVDEHDRHLGSLERPLGPQRGEVIGALGFPHPPPDARPCRRTARSYRRARSARPRGPGWCLRRSRPAPARPQPAC